ncbi:MAG: pyruvate:ferredoxin (flavodoxin) oxidoreductase [Treponema sp.]|nr:pyruvate:ferredoxin (flavodoxin) oxidoreductase [Treponema sp.]
MADKNMVIIKGNNAAAHVAHALSEVIAIYPITPSSDMGEISDVMSAQGRKNIWGAVPEVVELQSEAGAAGAVHGALTAGGMSTTFTASQGLLLKIPNMYKIAGELTPSVFHIAARALATSSLSIFGDHQDVMACRQSGFAMLSSNNVQEVMDIATIAYASTLRSRVPFLHFFDGFRTSHEIQKVEEVPHDVMRQLITDDLIVAHRSRGLSPEKPHIRGTSQNPDTYFQSREAVNPYYLKVPGIVQEEMDKFAKLTGRAYKLFEYVGAKDAERVVIIMGSGGDTCHETVEYLVGKGEKIGLLKVRLYRPFAADLFVKALPASVKAIAVLDRTKDPGAPGEPLYEDVRTAISEAQFAGKLGFADNPLILGGRYGLGSKDFTPAMAKAVFENLSGKKIQSFTVGINDDLTSLSLDFDENFTIEEEGMSEAMFYGLGSDGTVGANENTIKIIGEAKPELSVQGYFSYDSKKSGGLTVSHLRFGKKAIRRPYLINNADFLACHKFSYMEIYDLLAFIKEGGTFLLNSPFAADKVWKELPVEAQKRIIDKKVKFFVIDAAEIARQTGMGNRINTVMQAAYFKISGVLPEAEAIKLVKEHVQTTYGKRGKEVVEANYRTIDKAVGEVHEVKYPSSTEGNIHMKPTFATSDDSWVKEVLGGVSRQQGNKLPVSKIPNDGTFPTATSQYEKRSVAEQVPIWNADVCIQCGNCIVVCPHACMRLKNLTDAEVKSAPPGFKVAEVKPKAVEGKKAILAIAAEDCYGCGLCFNVCPMSKDPSKTPHALTWKSYADDPSFHAEQVKVWEYFLSLPEVPDSELNLGTMKGLAYKRPLFEFSGACGGCGETPYVKMLSQLFGDRMVIGNATGCSSIYGGNLPTTPYCKRADGRGPVWSNSLFEDTAEFAFGMRISSDKLAQHAREMAVKAKSEGIAAGIIDKLLANDQKDNEAIEQQRKYVDELKAALKNETKSTGKLLLSLADHFVKRSVWAFGGDGWAYDIGFGGLDHVIASNKNINLLVMDTEVYSNTGGQMSKATPTGAIAKFANAGKETYKKDLGAIAMSYGHVYVARVSMGADVNQVIKAFREAESYNGPSIIIAYAHCIAHGIDMSKGLEQGKAVVTSGIWPIYRYDPRLKDQGKNPFQLDCKDPTTNVEDYMYKEGRFRSLKSAFPERADTLLAASKAHVERVWKEYKYLAERPF